MSDDKKKINNSNLEFRKIKSLDFKYEVNSNGTIFRNVKSKKQNKIKLDMHHSKSGYYTTFVHLNGRTPDDKTKRVMIHSVVAECFLGDRPEGYEIDHIDRNSKNNDYTNLRYVTKSEQMKNRDHTNIAANGAKNFANHRESIMKPVYLYDNNNGSEYYFESTASCSRFIAENTDINEDRAKRRLTNNRKYIGQYDVVYLDDISRNYDNN